jgi:hypothetical protein
MCKLPHDLNLVDEWFFAKLLTVCSLLREGLYSVLAIVLVFDHQVDRREVTLSDLLDGLEQLVEATLIQSDCQVIAPCQQLFRILAFP